MKELKTSFKLNDLS